MAFKEYKGEIIPFGFEDEAIDKILDYEGGYNPKDPVTGKPVKYGIDQRANPDIDVSNISKEDAREIYRNRYWDKSGAASLPKDLALVHFDATVNQGSAAKRFLEESGGDINKYLDLRRQHYIYLAESNPEKFGSSLKGWLNRLDKVEKDIEAMEKPKFREYTGEIFPLDGKAAKKPAGEYQLSPEEQMMAPIGADTTGGIELSDYGKLFGAGAVKGTLGAPEAIEAGTQGLARDTIFKPTEVLEYLADPQKLQQAVANAFGFKVKEKRGETPLTDLKESQQRAVDEVLTRGKIPQLRDLTEIGNSISQYMEDSVTPEMKEALAESQPTGNIIEAFNTGDFSKLSFGDKPSFAGLAGQAVRVFGTSTPAILTSIITKSPLAGGTVAFGQAGSEGVEEARKHIEGMDFEELSNKSEYFRNLVALGYSPEKAKEMTIAKAGDTAAYMQGIIGALGNEFTANLITGKLSKSALLNASNVATRVTKAVAAGAAEDAFQETMEGIATDLGIDKTVVREIGVDSFANMVLGAIGGGGPGFVGGVKGEIGRAPKGAEAPEERIEPTFREVTPEEMQNMVPITPEEEFAGAPTIDITGVGEVPAEEAPATTQDIAAMMAELEEKAPQAPVEEPKVEEPKLAEPPKEEAPKEELPKAEEGKAVSIKDMTPEDQKSIREMEVEKNKISREKKLFPEFLARQGIQPSEKKDLGLEGISRPRIFRNSAPTFDELTSRAISEGFLLSTGDDVQDVENFREHVANYIGNGVISTGPDTAREGQIGSIDDAIAQIYRKYEKPEFGLEQPTPEQLKAEAARKKAEEDAEIDREMAEKARQSREEIKRRSEAAATEFELGRTAEEDLTGQKRLDDPDADIPFFSMPAKKKLPPGRNAELAEAAQRLRDGNITKREYDDIVKRLDPAKLYAEVPAPASDEKMVEALDVNKREKIHPQIADGQRVGTRLDIPAARKGAFVVSIHQPRTPSKVGQVIGYDSTAILNDVVFATGNEKKALEIASGGAKDVLQTIEGSWQNVAPAEAERMAKEAIDSPEWIQVGVNPTRHSYFYDRDTMEPVVQADQIIQIGNLVLAKNPTYASKESFLFAAPQDLLAKQDERIREELRDEKIAELQSVKQRMAAIQRRFADKKLKPLDQEIYAGLIRDAKDLEEAILDLYDPNLTPEAFLASAARSLANKKDGITQDVYDIIHSLYKKNPKLLEGLRLSVKTFKGNNAPEGEFKPYTRIVNLYKGTSGLTDPRVIMHEINHSLEQMMTRESRKAVVSAWRKALEEAAKKEESPMGINFFNLVNQLIKNPNQETFYNAVGAMPDASYYQYITPSEYWAMNSEALMASYLGGAWQRFKTSVKALFEALKNVLGMPNRWVIYKAFDNAINGERKGFQQMNDYIQGVVPMYSAHKNFAGGPAPLAEWTSPDESKIADFIYKIQDKFIDVKDVQKAIVEEIDSIDDRFNAYMKEELYHGRTAKRIEDFLRYELLPIIKKLKSAGISITEFDDFLHNRHAEERNKQVAKVNPAMPDQGSGIKTADAQAYLAGLDPKQRAAMENIANDIDNMIRGTQQLLVDYGLEEQSTIDQWNKTYKHYVPLMRDDLDFAHSVTGLGQGLATRGKTSKRATGSLKDVVDIFANLAIQRERAIIRGEKSRVGKALYGLAIQNPNPDFWLPVNPDAIKDTEGLLKELINIGLSPEDARNFIKEPSTQDIDPKTGLVTKRVNVNNRYADNVFSVRVNGKDRFIFFNPSDPRAMRMVKAMKNMDAEQFGGIIGNIANITRFVASVNTQYNPVFGAWNFARDVQGAAFNLSTTPIAGKQKEVMAGVFPALRAIYKDLRAERKGRKADGEWVDLFERFEKAGAKTGYRDQFAQSRKKANIIEREMANLNRGNVRKVAGAVMDWLSDYNDSMENAVRLSAFKVGLDQGLSEEQAASMAKNLTVNFNRKGAWSQGLGALYAFFNASVQGSARILETLRGPAGKKIIAGGMLLGVFQALALMMAGFDEDEPPEFLKDKNLIIPYGGEGKYFIVPMPLGFSAIPSTGRRISEMVIYGGNIPQKTIGLMGMLMDAFNPMGNGSFAQMLSPTAVDPFVSADMNKDSFGRPIYKEDKSTNPTPGYERSREGASDFSKGLSWLLNYISSGGYEYKKGFISPTADEIDYVIGQYTGGVGREVMKAVETVKGAITGEEVPPHRKPVTGKILGDINTPQAITGKFYKNITEMAQHEHQIKGMSKNDEDVDTYMEESPESALYKKANDVENRVNEINKKIKKLRDTKDEDNKDAIKDLEESKIELMKDFNEMVKEEKAQ